jgi:phospholipid/cholesterol/gamma-HCH transport system substrate-binding protein
MREQIKSMLIGLFLISGLALIIFIIMFLKPSVGDEKETLYVRFSNINKINVGTRVTFAGRPVGEVVAIREITNARAQPTDSIGRVYFYELTLKIDSSVKVYNTDKIDLQTSGLLGEKSVAIIPIAPPKGVTPELITSQPVYADSIDPIENAFYELSAVSSEIEKSVKEFSNWFIENENNISYAIKQLGGLLHESSLSFQRLNEIDLLGSIKEASDNFTIVMNQIEDGLDQLYQGDFFKNVSSTMGHVNNASASVETVMQEIAQGRGTFGRLIKGDDLYLRVTAIMSKVDTLMNDINHYGLLFNLNKQWQRLRAQRVSFLNALDTPAEFKDYFELEVDQINTAMSRISMLVDKARGRETILQSDAFKSDFAELLRKVDALSNNLKLYNQQLVESLGN